jgi:UDPglucose--hexose-1-phosphate uridylyltransferase
MFDRTEMTATFLDPRDDFREKGVQLETRVDPLTGLRGRIAHFSVFPQEQPDYAQLRERSPAERCPFCRPLVEQVTPLFPSAIAPEGRIQAGEAIIFPNIAPYGAYSAVARITDQHIVAPGEFTATRLVDGLVVCQEYINRLLGVATDLRYCSVGWNYMPYSGGSLLHPHLQVMGGSTPTTVQAGLERERQAYAEAHGGRLIADFLGEEQRRGERYLGTTGSVVWLVPFMPRGVVGELMAVVPERAAFQELTRVELGDLADGLIRALRFFADRQLYHWNMAIDFSVTGDPDQWIILRLVPRIVLMPSFGVSDFNWVQVTEGDAFCTVVPEEFAAQARVYFRTE